MKYLHHSIYLLSIILLLFINCESTNENDFKKGRIYSVINNAESYSIVKVIAITDNGLEIDLYPINYTSRPKEISKKELDASNLIDTTKPMVLRFIISKNTFLEWIPERMK